MFPLWVLLYSPLEESIAGPCQATDYGSKETCYSMQADK